MDPYEKGIIGLGSRTTLYYLNQINTLYNIEKGGFSTSPFLLINSDFDNINPFLPNQYNKIQEHLILLVNKAKELGIKKLLLPNITIYETLQKYPEIIKGIEVIDPITEVIQLLTKDKTMLIIGSKYTSCSVNLANRFEASGIRVNSTDSEITDWVDDFRIKIYKSKETNEEVTQFNDLIDSLSKQQAVIVACTELSTVLKKGHKDVFDLVAIQINTFLL